MKNQFFLYLVSLCIALPAFADVTLICTLSETSNPYMQTWIGQVLKKLELDQNQKKLTVTRGHRTGHWETPTVYEGMTSRHHPDATNSLAPSVHIIRNYESRGGLTVSDRLEWLLVDTHHLTYEEKSTTFEVNPVKPGSYREIVGPGIFAHHHSMKYECIKL